MASCESRRLEHQPCPCGGAFSFLTLETLASHADTLTHGAVGFAVTEQHGKTVKPDEDAGENQHCSSHRYEWRTSYTVWVGF